MSLLFTGLCLISALVSFGAFVVILIAAFRDEIWKGLLCIICQIYAVYFAFTNYDLLYVNNIPILWVWLGASCVSMIFRYLATSIK